MNKLSYNENRVNVMKNKKFIAITMLCLLVVSILGYYLINSFILNIQIDRDKFNNEDFVINDKSIDADNVKEVLGEARLESLIDLEVGLQQYKYEYDGITVSVFNKTGIDIEVNNDKYTGPRGVKVGNTKEEIISLFKEDRDANYNCYPLDRFDVEKDQIEYIYPSSDKCGYYENMQIENSVITKGIIQYAYETKPVENKSRIVYFMASPPYIDDEYTMYDYSRVFTVELENNIVTSFKLQYLATYN
jgi:hypothetical protein